MENRGSKGCRQWRIEVVKGVGSVGVGSEGCIRRQ